MLVHEPTDHEINDALFGEGAAASSIATRWGYNPNVATGAADVISQPRVLSRRIGEDVFGGPDVYPLESPAERMTVTTQEVKGQKIGVGVLDCRRETTDAAGREGETIVVTLGYDAALDTFEMQRYEAAAAKHGLRIVLVETPGVGMYTSRPRFVQLAQQALGSFRRTGSVMADAAWQAADLKPGEKVSFMGFSMGVSTGAELVRRLDKKGANVNKIYPIEPAGNQKHGLRGILAAVAAEEPNHDRYFKQNQAYDHLVAPLDKCDPATLTTREREYLVHRQHRLRQLVLSMGSLPLIQGRLNSRLVSVIANGKNGLQDAEVVIVGFDGSHMSRMSENLVTAELIEQAQSANERRLGLRRGMGGIATRQAVALLTVNAPNGHEPLSHPAWHSAPIVNFVFGLLADMGVLTSLSPRPGKS